MARTVRLLFASLAVFSGVRWFALLKTYRGVDAGFQMWGSSHDLKDVSDPTTLPLHEQEQREKNDIESLQTGTAYNPTSQGGIRGSALATSSTTQQPRIILIRSIGNALPPRHDTEQAIRNLNFTLHHEERFESSRRHWLLNRIANESMETQLIDMLRAHGENYTIIPFDLQTYSEIPLQFPVVNGVKDVIHSMMFRNLSQLSALFQKQSIEGAIQHERVLYTGNVNQARNLMIDIGLTYDGAEWILPLDGNCFLTPGGYNSILDVLDNLSNENVRPEHNSTKYVVVPMVRLKEPNEVLFNLGRNESSQAVEEPQIVFHRTAEARFHPKLRYGRVNKLELIKRLRVPGEWDKWAPFPGRPLPWDLQGFDPPVMQEIKDLHPNSTVASGGWVYRLFSGNAAVEKRGAAQTRSAAREKARFMFLGALDGRVVSEIYNFTVNSLLFYNEEVLRNEANSMSNTTLSALEAEADEVMSRLQPGDSRQVRCRRALISRVQTDITTLAIASRLSGRNTYGEKGAALVRRWFLDEATKLPSDFLTGMCSSEPHPTMNGLFFMLDGVRLLYLGSFLTDLDMKKLRSWFVKLLKTLAKSPDHTAFDKRGLTHDLQMIAVSAFVGDFRNMLWYLDTSVSRLQVQLGRNGALVFELESVKDCERNQITALYGWAIMARLGSRFGRHLWEASSVALEGKSMPALCAASYHAVPFFRSRESCSSTAQRVTAFDWEPAWHEARQHCSSLRDSPRLKNKWLPDKPSTWTDSNETKNVGQHAPWIDSVVPFARLGGHGQ